MPPRRDTTAAASQKGTKVFIAAVVMRSASRPRSRSPVADLAAFLAARLDEDEATAVAAGHADGSAGIAGHSHWLPAYGTVVDAEDPDWAIFTETLDEINAHIARHDPARVLREVAAKRAILAEHRPEPMRFIEASRCPKCREPWPCGEARALAAVYRDHPDYDQNWA